MIQRLNTEIYETIKLKLRRGAGNKDLYSWPGVKQRIEFIDRAKVILSDYLIEQKISQISKEKTELGNIFIIALLAEALECGNCGETAAITLVEYIKGKYPGSAEIILLLSSNSFLALDHFLVAIDRDNSIKLEDIYKWKGRLVDYWGNINYVFGESKENIQDLLYDIIGKKDNIIIREFYHIDNCAEYLEKHKSYLFQLFSNLKTLFNSPKCKELLERKATKWLDITFDEFQDQTLKLINRDINIYRPKPFLITHWESPSDYKTESFKPRPKR